MPKFLADALMNPAIAEHHEFAAGGNDKEQHAAVIFSARHAKPHESFFGSLVDVAPEERCNRNTNLTRGPVLGLLNGTLDLFLIDDPDEFFSCHYHDPLAPPPPDRPPPPLNPPPPQPPPPPQSSRPRRPPPERMLKRRSMARLGFVTKIMSAMIPRIAKKMSCTSGIGCCVRRAARADTVPPPITVMI